MPVEHEPNVDGRRARRQRSLAAVSEAMIDLVFEGNLPPTADQVAARAGVSVASLFRYFETLDDLRRQTIDTYFDRYAHLFDIPGVGEGPLDERIAHFVESRATLYETTEPMCRLVRLRAHDVEEANQLVHLINATLADQVRHHFDPELARLAPAAADDITIAACALTSFESWDLVSRQLGRTPPQVRRAWERALSHLLTPHPLTGAGGS
ncbi:MAG TPA: TetR/AcrR family transcriptional regulator [Ilumatobacter sp.]